MLFRSGGGAVYHDHGNLNWSFIVPGGLDDRASLLALIVEALRSQGIPASSGTRGEIMAGGYKIGGTASAAGKGTLLFHGTILVDADLSLLNKVLAAHLPSYQGDRTLDQSRQGVASVPAAVGNASWFHPGLLPQDLAGALSASTRAIRPADWTSLIDKNKVESMAQTYASPSWIYHRTQKGTL